jgi:dephospho-CoA kinase
MKKQKQNLKKKIILGLTGSFGSGKTSVARIFRSYGAKIIDADKLTHQVIRPGENVYKGIVKIFGRQILKQNKSIDRRKLARIVFGDRKLLIKINRIMHPEIIRMIKKKIRTAPAKIVILDAPLLIEAGLETIVDKLIVVTLTRKKQIERILKKHALKKSDIIKRIEAQMPLEKKVRLADFIIDNNGSVQTTKKQVQRIRRMLWKIQI